MNYYHVNGFHLFADTLYLDDSKVSLISRMWKDFYCSNKTEEEMSQELKKNVSGAELEHLLLKAMLNKIEHGHCLYGSLLWLLLLLLMAFIYCYSLPLSRLTAFLPHVIVNEWLYSFIAFNLFSIHWSGVLTVAVCSMLGLAPAPRVVHNKILGSLYENLLNGTINQSPQCVDTCEKITYAY